ncbi:MAG: hypothetical protein LBQ74_19930 [Prevotella sp.]|jgi:hypothetical protein|nr:hypothetical protein [Prevotella sp.]
MNKFEEPLRVTEDEGDVIDILLTPEKTPIAYERKLYELINKTGMTKEEAEHYLLAPIPLEIFYAIDQGLFGVESEALCSTSLYNPYSGEEIPNDNLI